MSFELNEGLVSEGLSDTFARDVGENVGETANPVAAYPPPRDFYKVPNMYTADNMHECGGTMGMACPTGNLQSCAVVCGNCPLCTAFVHNDEPFMGQTTGGWCSWQTVVPADPCTAPTCNRDSYARCPSGKWSDGISADARCFSAPHEYVKTIGTASCDTAGTNINCNSGTAVLEVPDRNLETCATMCKSCAIGDVQCIGFARSTTTNADGNETDVCTFKSSVMVGTTPAPVNMNEDLYTFVQNGTWSDGTFTEGKPAPPNFHLEAYREGGTDINCNAGSSFLEYGADGNITQCALVCKSCKVGLKTCVGFIRDSADKKCHFKTDGGDVEFGSTHSSTADAYHACSKGMFSEGIEGNCMRPDDWIITVETGSGDDCTCEGRSVADRRFSSATFTFDVVSGDVPMFISSKPQIVAPCSNSTCGKTSDVSLRTSGAGYEPTAIRITADSTDAWCMKSVELTSAKLGKTWTAATDLTRDYSSRLPLWINPGMTDNGQCLPPTTAQPDNNWGWCRWIGPGLTSNSTVCNTAGNPTNAFWYVDLMRAPEPTPADSVGEPEEDELSQLV